MFDRIVNNENFTNFPGKKSCFFSKTAVLQSQALTGHCVKYQMVVKWLNGCVKCLNG